MVSCDVAIVGGGPAGSTCAWKLAAAGLDVVVMDRSAFPRHKVCAGWITPPAVEALQLDVPEYRRVRTFQVITGFSIGIVGRSRTVTTTYDGAVSFAIRRSEFDEYLLRRSGARLRLGTAVTSIRREGEDWILNEAVRAPMLVGAGGHFCPVARWLNGAASPPRAPLVAAQEAEWRLEAGRCGTAAERPELLFCPDLKGYGWCVRKGDFVNVGLGRIGRESPRDWLAAFVRALVARGALAPPSSLRWCGHAYLLRDARHRRAAGEGVLLVGDAAGVADARSGEGIRQAIESGLVAAAAIVGARGCYTRERLEPYAAHLFAGAPESSAVLGSRVGASAVGRACGRALVAWPPFVRHVVLDRWFLRRRASRLAPA